MKDHVRSQGFTKAANLSRAAINKPFGNIFSDDLSALIAALLSAGPGKVLMDVHPHHQRAQIQVASLYDNNHCRIHIIK